MRVILNVDAITAPLTGIGNYTLHLARGLAGQPEISELKLYSAYRFVSDPEQALGANQTIAALRRNLPFKRAALEAYTALRGALFRFNARGRAGWLLHSPNYIVLPHHGPAVSTVHDLSYLRHPQHHPVERVRYLERHLPRTLARVQAVITDSEFIKAEIVREFSVPAARVHAVPLGVDSSFHPRAGEHAAAALARHGLSAQAYLLAVATLEPRKNLVRLVAAYAGLPARLRERLPLVVAGARGWLNAELSRVIEPLERAGQVRRLGYVEQADLPAIYAGAHGFALPSFYEGFGLPPLEAMASGVPVLTSNVSSLPEVTGGCALLVDPSDSDAIRAGLTRLIEDEDWREKARAGGLERAREFTWERCVARTMDVYRDAIALAG